MSRLLLLASVLFFVSLGCGGPSFRGGVYRGDGLTFRTGEVPATWRRLDASDSLLAFRDEGAESTVLLNGRCGRADDDVPLAALTSHLFLTFTEREMVEQKLVPMDGREAMHTMLRAKLDGVLKGFEAYVLKKDACVFDFVQVSAPTRLEANRPAFERFVSGFHTLSDGS